MNFFHHIHRSVVEPVFYREVIHFPGKKVILFILKLVVLTALISAVSHTIRIIDRDDGLPDILPRMFPGMVITARGMVLEYDSAYTVNSVYIAECISLLNDLPLSLVNVNDSTVFVTEKKGVSLDTNSLIRALFTADDIQLQFVPRLIYWQITYADLVPEKTVVTFTPETVRRYLLSNGGKLFSYVFLVHILRFGLNIISSIFILSFAAFIFRTRDIYQYGQLLKIASFASVPISIIACFTAIAGVNNFWISQSALFMSGFILFRAIVNISTGMRETIQGEDNDGVT